MDQVAQRPAPAEIVRFPGAPRVDEALLTSILDNMSQGVLLFDQQTRLIFSNRRYCEMYGLPPEAARPGRMPSPSLYAGA